MPESAAHWAAVIVNYNAGPLLARCASSVLADSSSGPVELVVVDNGSSDDSLAELAARVPEARVVLARDNLGYARAANFGIAVTAAPLVAVLNPDTEVTSGTARAMRECFQREPSVGAAGPLVVNTDGTVYPSARRLPSTGVAVGHGALRLVWPTNPWTRRYRDLDADPAVARLVDWVSGAAIWLRRSALDDVGGWDERYFMYVEDVDLCDRLRARGWGVVYEPAGRVQHVQGASTSRVPYRMIVEHHRSLFRFAEGRWRGPRRALLPAAAAFLSAQAGVSMGHHALEAVRARRRVGGPSASPAASRGRRAVGE